MIKAMMTPADADLTLPSILAALGDTPACLDLVLTIIFHPDTSRIGYKSIVPLQKGTDPWVLGRNSPTFNGDTGLASKALEDRHVSRVALQFVYQKKRLMVRRFESASRCCIGSTEVQDSVELRWDKLLKGVPIMLAHSIVLMLRLAKRRAVQVPLGGQGNALRGGSACIEAIHQQVIHAAKSDVDVMIRGETGTGKELVATAIHRASGRAEAPMVSVNMAAIPSELAAAALFGSSRGAFTGADRATLGYFEQAQGGSLFLDEIGETSLEVQPLLLRALQQREIQVVGGVIKRIDVRVISATDAALDAVGCDFKAALRHRLGAFEIVLPPLREHPEDIGELLLYFLQGSAAEAQRSEVLPQAQSAERDIAAWALLFFRFVSYSWPGNVRELANFSRQIILASEKNLTLNDHLYSALFSSSGKPHSADSSTARRKIDDIDDAAFDQAMVSNGCEALRVALQLGVSRSAVYRRIKTSIRYRLATDIPLDELQSMLIQHDGDSIIVARQLQVSVKSLRCHLRNLHLLYT
jgi:DNA-binding NtrC family response regulator